MVTRRQFIGQGGRAMLGLHLGGLAGMVPSGLDWDRAGAGWGYDPKLERRKEYLAILRRVLPETEHYPQGRFSPIASTWEEWLEKTGELPPDFLNMPSAPFLPGPLVDVSSGTPRPIETVAQWEAQRGWIREQYQQWILGRTPPKPDNLIGERVSTEDDGEVVRHHILLRFGPDQQATLRLEIILPGGEGPFPVFLTNHPSDWPWVNPAVRRGYVGCVFKVGDPSRHDGDDSDPWIELYPEYDWATLARWAWAASRAVDYLLTLPYVDPERIAITGNSRYGKLSAIAGAFDERITAVVPSRGNLGGAIPWRHTTGMFVNEELQQVTQYFPHWYHPRLRFFHGREDRLPVDQNMLLSLVAPRGLMLTHAYTEHQGNPWAVEQSYRSIRSVYRFLGAEDRLGMLQRPGEHTTTPDVVEIYLDFFDQVFGREPFARREEWVNGYTFEHWQEEATPPTQPPPVPDLDWGSALSPAAAWDDGRRAIAQRIRWALGEEPPAPAPLVDERITYRATEGRRRTSVYPRVLIDRPLRDPRMGYGEISFGDELRADIYYPTDNEDGDPIREGLPTVIWLHPYAYAMGYSRYTEYGFLELTRRGFAVVGVDLVGCGTRVEQIREFYRRYPSWSLLGRSVEDVGALLTAMSGLALVDSSRVYVAGSGLGAKVGLFSAAMDPRIAGVASVCGFASLRDRTEVDGGEGLRHYSHLHGLLPRLGAFVDRPEDVPFDYDEVLALIAPRPTFIMAPTLDRYHPVESVRGVVERAGAAFTAQGARSALRLETPEGFNGYETEWHRQDAVRDWLVGVAAP